MTQKKIPPDKAQTDVNCFGFYRDKHKRPKCHALLEMCCLTGDGKCKFRATPQEAAEARQKSQDRRVALGIRDKY